MNNKIKEMVISALFVALIIIGSWIKIPIPYVPFTLQLLFTMSAGMLLGPFRGFLTVSTYLLIGLLGIPIFTEGGGIAYVLKPTFGYLIGFALGAYVTGKIVKTVVVPTFKRLLVANLTGLVIVYLCGVIYLYFIRNFYLSNPIDLWNLLLYGIILAVPGDLGLCLLAAILGKRLIPIMNKEQL